MRQKLLVPAAFQSAAWHTTIGVDKNGDVGLALDVADGPVLRLKLSTREAINVMASLHEVIDAYLIGLHADKSAGTSAELTSSQSSQPVV